MERYSASAEERETVCCFLVFQEIGDFPRKTNLPVSDRRVKGQLAQSESHHPYKVKSLSLRNKIPCPGFPFKYRITLIAASQCSCFGCCMN